MSKILSLTKPLYNASNCQFLSVFTFGIIPFTQNTKVEHIYLLNILILTQYSINSVYSYLFIVYFVRIIIINLSHPFESTLVLLPLYSMLFYPSPIVTVQSPDPMVNLHWPIR